MANIEDVSTYSPALPESGSRIADTVAAHLEPVTRFDRSDISQDAPDQSLCVDLTLMLEQSATFDISWYGGPRQLPQHITLLNNASRLKVVLTEQLGAARDGCDDAIRAWVECEPHAYRRVLPPDATFRNTPGNFGIEFTCQNCYGKCKTQCTACTGTGNLTCHACQGEGSTRCHQCAGSARVTCSSCNGTCVYQQYVSEQQWDAATSSFLTVNRAVETPCTGCFGSGTQHCPACANGRTTCNTCSGQKTVTCVPCSGVGSFACTSCEATGVQHEWACVTAKVATKQVLLFGVPVDQTLETIVRERIAADQLPAYGAYLGARHDLSSCTLSSEYLLRIDAVHAHLHAAERHFALYGLGPQSQVLDFVNIAGHLLEDDLATLERAAVPVALWAQPQGRTLIDALKLFIASELNLLIAEQVSLHQRTGGAGNWGGMAAPLHNEPALEGRLPSSRATGSHARAQQAAPAVEAHFKSMVDAAYVERATVALRQGFTGLYGADLLRPALALIAATGVFSALLLAFGPSSYGPWNCTGWAVAAGALGWIGIEFTSLHRIMGSFPERIGARLHAQIKEGGAIQRWRVSVAAGVIAAAFLSVTVAAKIPFIQRSHAGPVTQAKPMAAPLPTTPWSIEKDRTTATKEGLYEVQQEARKFIAAHNKKNKTRFTALEPNLKMMLPRCKSRMTVAWVPKEYGLSSPAVFVRCSKSVSEHERKWEAIVPVAKK